MRIGIFTDTYKPDVNGCAQSVEVLSNNLQKLGHAVFIFCPGNNLLIEKHGNIIAIPALEAKKFYGYKIAQPIHPHILKVVEDLKLDIIHAETEFGVGTLANLVAFNLNIPRVRTYHTDYVDYTHYFVPKELGPIYDGAKRIVTLYNKFYGDHCLRLMTPSYKTKKGLLKANIKTEITVIPNGIELDRFDYKNTKLETIKRIRRNYSIKTNDIVFIYVGRLADEKSVDLIIKAFKSVKKNNLAAKLLIVGLGPSENKLHNLTKKLDLQDYVKFTGKINPDDVPSYYHSSTYFISASTSETQGLTYIEALASGLPVLAAEDECSKDVVVDGYNGYFFKDEVTCFKSILKALNNKETDYNKLKLNAIESTKKYNALKFAEDTANIYAEVIDEYKNSYRIIKTKLSNDVVKICLKNKLKDEIKLLLSLDDYVSYGFRKNSLVTIKTINCIKENEKLVLAFQNALRKLSMKDYSSKQMKDSLMRKYELNDEQIKSIISKLKNMDLLNDRKYTISRMSVLKESLLSKKAIINKLVKEGISKEIINELYIDDKEQEHLNAERKALKYLNTIKGKSLSAKKQAILSRLINEGFAVEESKDIVNKLDFSKDTLKEAELLKHQAEKAYNKYSKKYKDYELRNHIFNSLASKGFNLEAIYAVMNEMGY